MTLLPLIFFVHENYDEGYYKIRCHNVSQTNGNHNVSFEFVFICSVNLELLFCFIGVFHESTVCALEFYSEVHPEYVVTARYFYFISTTWKILSVKAPYKGTSFNLELEKGKIRLMCFY